jgi:hypothetical protein
MADTALVPQFSLRKSIPPFKTLITGAILIFLAWAFFSKITLQFYASFLFLFYSLTHSIWISVCLLGVFQTLILIPFRIINVTKSKHIKDFEKKVIENESQGDQSFLIKKSAKSGEKIILYYLIDFFVALTSYLSIGRLFLTDFYSTKLDPNLLYSFVPYPNYPLLDVWFKIPYLKITETKNLGTANIVIAFIVILFVSLLLSLLNKRLKEHSKSKILPLFTSSATLFMIAAYFLMRHFPIGAQINIFTGDVGQPNPQFNTITAIATALTILWLDIPVILKKVQLAHDSQIDLHVIRATQTQLFAETIRSAIVVGLGAYFITNKIPCAFELSIFTLEIISWLSPLTLDRFILSSKPESP